MDYAAFFCCLSFAQRARCAAAIFLRAAADMVRLPVSTMLSWPLEEFAARSFAQRAFCAKETFRRAAADKVRRCPLSVPRADELYLRPASGANALIALFNRFLSCSSSFTTAAIFAISSPV
jgi:hypothetical protein